MVVGGRKVRLKEVDLYFGLVCSIAKEENRETSVKEIERSEKDKEIVRE